jgi:hypothetical protein
MILSHFDPFSEVRSMKNFFIDLTSEQGSKWDSIMRYNDGLKYRVFRYIKR